MFYENRNPGCYIRILLFVPLTRKVWHVYEASSKLDHHESRDSGQTEADSDDAITSLAFTKTARWGGTRHHSSQLFGAIVFV